MSKDNDDIKVMADLLRQGSTLTGHSCPACFSPLFKIHGKGLWCVSCQKQVKIVKEGEIENHNYKTTNFSSLESTMRRLTSEVKRSRTARRTRLRS